jgi:DNA-binding MarR family transcriptional regulator
MDTNMLKIQIDEYCNIWHQMNAIYEEYAKSVGLSYTNLYALSIIATQENCTQKTICQQTMMPKQTVHAIITGFWKQGLVQLQELPTDRRNKLIMLTEAGKDYVAGILPKINAAEQSAMLQLKESQRSTLLETTKLYMEHFRSCMNESSSLEK